MRLHAESTARASLSMMPYKSRLAFCSYNDRSRFSSTSCQRMTMKMVTIRRQLPPVPWTEVTKLGGPPLISRVRSRSAAEGKVIKRQIWSYEGVTVKWLPSLEIMRNHRLPSKQLTRMNNKNLRRRWSPKVLSQPKTKSRHFYIHSINT